MQTCQVTTEPNNGRYLPIVWTGESVATSPLVVVCSVHGVVAITSAGPLRMTACPRAWELETTADDTAKVGGIAVSEARSEPAP